MPESEEPGLLSDSALESPEQDRLGYQDFSENIADTVYQRTPSDEFVVGIHGQWGSGKSTILNFVEQELERKDVPPVTVRFNPWWFSGQADLIEKFFSQLEASLVTGDDSFEDVRNRISTFASALSRVPLETVTGIPSGRLLQFVAQKVQTEDPNLNELKIEISEGLKEADRQVVVFIDDLDRLTNEEIRQMFRLVKSVADFPNMIYVLAFDRGIVADALEGDQGVENGEEYLEKIIQLPQHVPNPS